MRVRPAKTQISLGIRPVWSESSPCAQWVAKVPSFLHADSEDSDQTGRMPSLIWVFAGRTITLLVLSCRGSYKKNVVKYSKLCKFQLRRVWRGLSWPHYTYFVLVQKVMVCFLHWKCIGNQNSHIILLCCISSYQSFNMTVIAASLSHFSQNMSIYFRMPDYIVENDSQVTSLPFKMSVYNARF